MAAQGKLGWNVEGCWNASACALQEFAGLEVSYTGQMAASAPREVTATPGYV